MVGMESVAAPRMAFCSSTRREGPVSEKRNGRFVRTTPTSGAERIAVIAGAKAIEPRRSHSHPRAHGRGEPIPYQTVLQ